jgi:hypothetical protein
MIGLNAQAMVLSSRHRPLELAVAEGLTPAALNVWHAVELGPLLDGVTVDKAVVVRLPAETPMRHYTK